MSVVARRGLSLVELLISLVLLGLAGTVMVRSSVRLSQATAALLLRTTAQQTLDQASGWLASELAQTGPGDLRRLGSDSISYRGYRASGLACLVTASEVRLLTDRLSHWRDPQPGRDTLLLYTGRPGDSAWVAQPLLSVGGASCDGRPALRLQTVTDSSTLATVASGMLVPVRLFERMQVRFYLAAGQWWLGARSESTGEAIQPLAGPFLAGGVRFSYADSLRQPSFVASTVRQLILQLIAAAPGTDSALLRLAPRNLAP